MKTLKDLEVINATCQNCEWESGGIRDLKELEELTVRIDDLKQEAVKILKQNKQINTADWVEFFNIEEEFADAVLGVNE